MAKVVGSLARHPARVSVSWYAAIIMVGGVLLTFAPCAAAGRSPISLLEGLFTATSATCVTGLTVRSAAHDFSLLGQVVILALVQLGGVGIITVTTFVTLELSGQLQLRDRALVAEALGTGGGVDLRWVLVRVIRFSLIAEGAGVLLLALRFALDRPWATALWHALFHSISAFCNAGFALHDDNLVPYQGDLLVNGTIISLIVVGGVGFPVLLDIQRHWRAGWRACWPQLTLHSKIMIAGTGVLLIGGALAFGLLEWQGALRGLPFHRRLCVCLLQSATCRTAGFNSVDLRVLTDATMFLMILMMFVGGGPCSTAGGCKVSTVALLILRGAATIRGQRHVCLGRRTVPGSLIDRATTTALLYTALAFAGLMALLVAEHSADGPMQAERRFLDIMFEVFSALGTVGLSTGVTPQLSAAGEIIVMMLMFIGRLGPIVVAAALSQGEQERRIEYAPEEPLIG